MKFPLRRLLPALILLPVLGLTACKSGIPQFTAAASCNSNGGCSANYSQPAKAQTSPPETAPSSAPQGTPAPAVTVTVTPAPLPQPTVTVTATTYAGISQCVPASVTELFLENIAGSPYGTPDGVITLTQCLQIPQPNQSQFQEQVETYADLGQQSGLFDTQQGRDAFARSSRQVQCPNGQWIYSLNQIYAQYG